jgi:hypothetical protein
MRIEEIKGQEEKDTITKYEEYKKEDEVSSSSAFLSFSFHFHI